jgi:hypothetical protein
MFCTNCGETLEETALFCTGCGQQVDRDAMAPPPPDPPFAPAPEPPTLPPGGRPMATAPPPATPRPSKPGNSKLFLWMGALVALLAVTLGLAYVAFQQFVQGGFGGAPETEAVAPELQVTETQPDAALESAPQIDDDNAGEADEAIRGAIAGAPLAEAPVEEAPIVAPKPAEPAPKPAPAPKPNRSEPAAPKPVAKSTPPVKAEPKPADPAASVIAQAPPAPPPAAPRVTSEPAAPPPSPKGGKVMLSGSEAYSPPPAPEPAAPAGAPAPAVRPAPTAGDVFWTGTLKKNQRVVVDFSAGNGGVGGQALPGKPVKLETFSPVVEIVELPGPENGWKRFAFKATRDAKKSVTLNFHWALAQ